MLLRSAPPVEMPKMPRGQMVRVKLGCMAGLGILYGAFVWHLAHEKIAPRPHPAARVAIRFIKVPMVLPPAPPSVTPALVQPDPVVFSPPKLVLRHAGQRR
ncbi:hypothetical protein AZ09_12495 [Acetobacter aceti 1023]|nr:hypothetical protein AZ09_12495 [Acetobacter aceti 1023]